MQKCLICPRECGVNRSLGTLGYCQSDSQLRVARAALHMWEEPCISGDAGSGTIFFVGCNLGCVFCQNREISRGNGGKMITTERLADIFLELQEQEANNINLVTPTHYIQQIISAIAIARGNGLRIPIVYNSSGYEKPEILRNLTGLVDIYLPDFKYYDSDTAARYSCAADYPKWAKISLSEMVEQVGEARFDEKGMMIRGVLVRHLMLPGRLEESKRILEYLHDTYGNRIFISIMNQYTPLLIDDQYPELKREVTQTEYDDLVNYAVKIGIENGFIQEGETCLESFIPMFDNFGV